MPLRVFRPRIMLFSMSDEEVFRRYRFPPHIILELTAELQQQLRSRTQRCKAVPPLVKVLATLHFCATGSFQRTSGAISGLSQSTLSRCIHQVIPALVSLMGKHIIRPHDNISRRRNMQAFYAVAGFPRVIGAVDCTHIALTPPTSSEQVYRNRKHWHSVNVQVVADAKCVIWHVRADHPGSSHDSYIFRHSALAAEFENGVYGDSWLLGMYSKQIMKCRQECAYGGGGAQRDTTHTSLWGPCYCEAGGTKICVP